MLYFHILSVLQRQPQTQTPLIPPHSTTVHSSAAKKGSGLTRGRAGKGQCPCATAAWYQKQTLGPYLWDNTAPQTHPSCGSLVHEHTPVCSRDQWQAHLVRTAPCQGEGCVERRVLPSEIQLEEGRQGVSGPLKNVGLEKNVEIPLKRTWGKKTPTNWIHPPKGQKLILW